MRRSAFILSIAFFAINTCFAQSKKLVRTYGIEKCIEQTTKYSDGVADTSYISEYEVFNKDGKWIEKIDLYKDGQIKKRERRVLDGDLVLEEITEEPAKEGESEDKSDYKHRRYTYDKTDLIKIEKLNREGSVTETTQIIYNKYGDEEEEIVTNSEGSIKERVLYTYDDKGFKTLKSVFNGEDQLVETKRYVYE
jgi:hypothetical protein